MISVYPTPARDALDAFPPSPFSAAEKTKIALFGLSDPQKRRATEHALRRKVLESEFAAELKDRCYRLQERVAAARRIVSAGYDAEADLEARRSGDAKRAKAAEAKIKALGVE